MIETDAPETDAEAFKSRPPFYFVPADFARNLERERDDAREQLSSICLELFDNDDTFGGESAADYVISQVTKDRERMAEIMAELAQYRAAVQTLADQDFGAAGWNEQCNQAAILLRNLLQKHD